MHIKDILFQPFTLGLILGLIFAGLALIQVIRLKMEFKRFKRHLSDKLEIEADSMKRIKQEQESLRKENENLRVKVAALNELPDRKMQREVEIYVRAEKKLLVSVPGFAPAWESAKSAANAELEEEESGRSLPKRMLSRFFGSGSRKEEGLPAPDPANPVPGLQDRG